MLYTLSFTSLYLEYSLSGTYTQPLSVDNKTKAIVIIKYLKRIIKSSKIKFILPL